MNLKIVGIPGSNANHSYNRMLLEYISKAYEHDMTVVDVRKIPLFNESAKETPAAIQSHVRRDRCCRCRSDCLS